MELRLTRGPYRDGCRVQGLGFSVGIDGLLGNNPHPLLLTLPPASPILSHSQCGKDNLYGLLQFFISGAVCSVESIYGLCKLLTMILRVQCMLVDAITLNLKHCTLNSRP